MNANFIQFINVFLLIQHSTARPHQHRSAVRVCMANRCDCGGVRMKVAPGIATATLTYTWMLSTEQVNALVNNGSRLICN